MSPPPDTTTTTYPSSPSIWWAFRPSRCASRRTRDIADAPAQHCGTRYWAATPYLLTQQIDMRGRGTRKTLAAFHSFVSRDERGHVTAARVGWACLRGMHKQTLHSARGAIWR